VSDFRCALGAWRRIGVAVAAVTSLQPLTTSAQCYDDAVAEDVRLLLEARDFPGLDERVTETQEAYFEDYLKEPALAKLLDEFDSFDASLTEPLNAWVKASGSSAAHLARGIHRRAVGWHRRGCAFANETSEEQFEGMREQFALAVEDFDKVLELEPEQTLTYAYLIEIMMHFSADDEVELLYRQALSVNPRSLQVRTAYLGSLQPRWGGSIPQMEAAVADAREYFDDYPALKTLEAIVHAERGWLSTRAEDWPGVIRHYSAALAIDEDCDYYAERGIGHYMSRQYETAAGDYSEAIRLCPAQVSTYDFRGRARFYAKDYEGTAADMTYAIDHGRENPVIYQLRGDSYVRLRRYPEARQDLSRALELDPANDTPYYRDLRAWVDERLRYEAECAAIPGCVPGP
jgi:tetratricopeptide (TPR) repeat protein